MRFTVPTPLKIGLVVLGTTALYTYIGQLVPQKEVLPPAETVISSEMTTEQLVEVGRQVAENQGICLTCHTIGQSGGALRYPDLAGVGSRAETRVPGLSGVEYLAQSLYEPEAFIVPGFAGGMPPIHRPPIGLSADEIKAVIAWLQSMGGTPTVTLQTDLGYGG
jgi:mono/diheme cytochrome c family protein